MSQLLLNDMETPWSPSDSSVFTMTIDTTTFADPSGFSGLLVAQSGAAGATVEFDPPAPVVCRRSARSVSGCLAIRPQTDLPCCLSSLSSPSPMRVISPAKSTAGFVPVNSAGVWEQRRIGILGDRRSSITAFRFALSPTFLSPATWVSFWRSRKTW